MDRAKTFLLIVDYQERLVPVINQHEQILMRAQQLIQSLKVLQVPMAVTEQYPKGLGHTVPEITELLADNVPIYEKMAFSAYLPEIVDLLEKNQVEEVILCGIESHVCVYQTGKDLLKAGFKVQVVKDTISSRTAENAENGFDLLRDLGATITNTETLVYELMQKAGTPEFKQILKIIK